jgi:hypothetical protein
MFIYNSSIYDHISKLTIIESSQVESTTLEQIPRSNEQMD